MLEGENYYQKKSSKFDRYHFNSNAKLVKGEIPDFFELIKKYSDEDKIIHFQEPNLIILKKY